MADRRTSYPNMSQQIRLANGADLAGVLALYRELRPNDPVLESAEAGSAWNTVLNDPALSVSVATDDTVVVSTCMLGVIPTLARGGRPFWHHRARRDGADG